MNVKLISTWVFALILIAAGINHAVNPGIYTAFIPWFLPLTATNYFTTVVEAGLGLGLLFKQTSKIAATGTLLLMIFFLPFHVVDAFRAQPAIGSKLIAWIRLPLQFVLIYWAWRLIPKAR